MKIRMGFVSNSSSSSFLVASDFLTVDFLVEKLEELFKEDKSFQNFVTRQYSNKQLAKMVIDSLSDAIYPDDIKKYRHYCISDESIYHTDKEDEYDFIIKNGIRTAVYHGNSKLRRRYIQQFQKILKYEQGNPQFIILGQDSSLEWVGYLFEQIFAKLCEDPTIPIIRNEGY